VNKAFRMAAGLATGMLIGYGIGLFFAPASGEGTRSELQARIEEIRRAGQQAAQTRRIELQQQLDQLTQPR
jgi:gas vesicle protein